MTRFWSARTGRERMLLIATALALPVLAGWSLVWQPMQARIEAAEREIARYDALIHVALTAPDAAAAAPRPAVGAAPPARRIAQSAAQAGIALGRLEPDGGRVRVAVPQVGFGAALAWIATLEDAHGLRATAAEMTRLAQPGQVLLALELEEMR